MNPKLPTDTDKTVLSHDVQTGDAWDPNVATSNTSGEVDLLFSDGQTESERQANVERIENGYKKQRIIDAISIRGNEAKNKPGVTKTVVYLQDEYQKHDDIEIKKAAAEALAAVGLEAANNDVLEMLKGDNVNPEACVKLVAIQRFMKEGVESSVARKAYDDYMENYNKKGKPGEQYLENRKTEDKKQRDQARQRVSELKGRRKELIETVGASALQDVDAQLQKGSEKQFADEASDFLDTSSKWFVEDLGISEPDLVRMRDFCGSTAPSDTLRLLDRLDALCSSQANVPADIATIRNKIGTEKMEKVRKRIKDHDAYQANNQVHVKIVKSLHDCKKHPHLSRYYDEATLQRLQSELPDEEGKNLAGEVLALRKQLPENELPDVDSMIDRLAANPEQAEEIYRKVGKIGFFFGKGRKRAFDQLLQDANELKEIGVVEEEPEVVAEKKETVIDVAEKRQTIIDVDDTAPEEVADTTDVTHDAEHGGTPIKEDAPQTMTAGTGLIYKDGMWQVAQQDKKKRRVRNPIAKGAAAVLLLAGITAGIWALSFGKKGNGPKDINSAQTQASVTATIEGTKKKVLQKVAEVEKQKPSLQQNGGKDPAPKKEPNIIPPLKKLLAKSPSVQVADPVKPNQGTPPVLGSQRGRVKGALNPPVTPGKRMRFAKDRFGEIDQVVPVAVSKNATQGFAAGRAKTKDGYSRPELVTLVGPNQWRITPGDEDKDGVPDGLSIDLEPVDPNGKNWHPFTIEPGVQGYSQAYNPKTHPKLFQDFGYYVQQQSDGSFLLTTTGDIPEVQNLTRRAFMQKNVAALMPSCLPSPQQWYPEAQPNYGQGPLQFHQGNFQGRCRRMFGGWRR